MLATDPSALRLGGWRRNTRGRLDAVELQQFFDGPALQRPSQRGSRRKALSI
jgi:hypothetical protein